MNTYNSMMIAGQEVEEAIAGINGDGGKEKKVNLWLE